MMFRLTKEQYEAIKPISMKLRGYIVEDGENYFYRGLENEFKRITKNI